MQGDVLSYQIERASGAVEKHQLHNILSNGFALTQMARNAPSGALVCRTHSDRVGVDVAGVWQQVGTTISRVSGSGTITTTGAGWFAVFADGKRTWLPSIVTAVTSVTAVKSQSAPPQALKLYSTSTNTTTSVVQTRTSSESLTQSYSNGVTTCSVSGVRIELPPVAATATIKRISISPASPSGSDGSHFDLPADLVLNAGDTVVITGYSFSVTWDAYTPRVFTAGNSPIQGYRGSGKWQRTISTLYATGPSVPTMHLLTAANKVTLGNMSTTSVVIGATSESVVGTNVVQTPTVGNGGAMVWQMKATTVTGVNSVVQIVFAASSTAYFIIEFDTPINIGPNRIIKANFGDTFEIGIQTDVAPANTVAPALSINGSSNYQTTTGTWTGVIAYYTYQWYKNSTLVVGQTTDEYTLTGGLVDGDTLYCKVRAVNSGAPTGVAADSNTITIDTGSVPVNTVAPTISAPTREPGELVSITSFGTWTADPPTIDSYSQQWTRDGADIPGETSTDYLLQYADNDTTIAVKIVATNATGDSAPFSVTGVDVEFTPEVFETPVIQQGTGGDIAIVTTEGNFDYADTVTQQWYRNGVLEVGETGDIYAGSVDDGDEFFIRYTAVNGAKSASTDSNTITFVAAPFNTDAPSIAWPGSTYYGNITLDEGDWDGTIDTTGYQWYKNGSPVGGQTTNEYTSTLASGDDLFCRVTKTNTGGSTTADSNTMADYVPYAVDMVYAEDAADNNDYIVAQWNTVDDDTFPNEILFPQSGGGSFIGTVELELRLPGAGTYYVRLLNRNEAGDSAPDSTITVTAA